MNAFHVHYAPHALIPLHSFLMRAVRSIQSVNFADHRNQNKELKKAQVLCRAEVKCKVG